jgi:hypothetical protein
MMPRRNMSQALQTDNQWGEDAAAFLRAATPKPALPPEAPKSAEPPAAAEASPSVVAVAVPKPEAPPPARKPARPKPAEFAPSGGLVSMTFRVPAEIPAGLIRASADRKLRREPSASQQEIVAEALIEWLGRHHYLSAGTLL